MSTQQPLQQESQVSNGAILLGAGLALASFIVLPAVAARMGIGSSLTGAMRIALMKASTKVCHNNQPSNHSIEKSCPPEADCHQ
ncbi:MAG: hypothetical protein GQ529_01830 [Methyloprofundus sp.]|nr:hypothetical protein [Methyloprofundus sp.]